jgi:hypothetical protein
MNTVLKFPSKESGPLKLGNITHRPALVADDSINAETLLGMDFPPLESVLVRRRDSVCQPGRKSWWVYDASIAVATGRRLWAVFSEQATFYTLEITGRRVKDRFNAARRKLEITRPLTVEIAPGLIQV